MEITELVEKNASLLRLGLHLEYNDARHRIANHLQRNIDRSKYHTAHTQHIIQIHYNKSEKLAETIKQLPFLFLETDLFSSSVVTFSFEISISHFDNLNHIHFYNFIFNLHSFQLATIEF